MKALISGCAQRTFGLCAISGRAAVASAFLFAAAAKAQ